MARLVSADYTVDEYAVHLANLLGFYEPFEAALTATAAGPLPASRSTLIAGDLARLGHTAEEVRALPRCAAIPPFTDCGSLGALYVYEGSALGGQVIARRLHRSLGSSHPFHFYHSDALAAKTQWTAFCARLDAEAPIRQPAICETALAVFEAFVEWFERG